MGKQPAVIIIVRHGARLDAADKYWHLSSPTPYDPPLTYGGWTQSKTLGVRIASLVHAREESANGDTATDTLDDVSANSSGVLDSASPPRKRKHKIFIHSSPFLRCVQTGVGISAGISQFQGILASRTRKQSKARHSWESQGPPRLHAVDATSASVQARSNLIKNLRDQPKQTKTHLRIDAFLGEWLSPDYFDLITPPPSSTMMVAGAKADLLRRGENLDSYSTQPLSPSLGSKMSQGSLWSGSKSPDPTLAPVGGGPLDMKALSHALPGRDRTSSYSTGRVSPFGRPVVHRTVSSELLAGIGYNAPTPHYAISPIEPIPKGYVAHARDACVDVDYAWDSMRPPLDWGDGGEYGEEWSAMHKRFRKGLNELINWYGEHSDGVLADEQEAVSGTDDPSDPPDEDTEIVVVLVTHGAGCNALIGALTEQPVLIDVGMASMTMAVIKDENANGRSLEVDSPIDERSPISSPKAERPYQRSGSVSTGLSSKYEMKLVASSEHLRPGADPSRPSTSNPSSPSLAAQRTVPDLRRRSTLLSHAAAGSPLETNWAAGEHPRPSNMSTALGSIRRLSTQVVAPPQRSASISSAVSAGAGGLWTPSTPSLAELRAEAELPPVPKETLDPKAFADGSEQGQYNKLGISYVPDSKPNANMLPIRSKTEDPMTIPRTSGAMDSPSREMRDSVSELPSAGTKPPTTISRQLSQKGLWGSAPSGTVERDRTPKRRWTLQQD